MKPGISPALIITWFRSGVIDSTCPCSWYALGGGTARPLPHAAQSSATVVRNHPVRAIPETLTRRRRICCPISRISFPTVQITSTLPRACSVPTHDEKEGAERYERQDAAGPQEVHHRCGVTATLRVVVIAIEQHLVSRRTDVSLT